jgi:glycosyltransferase involved in cell wall biosynthesis
MLNAMSNTSDSLTFCIPAYNDQETITRVIERSILAGKALHVPFKINVLNDGSLDRTSEILSTLKKQFPTLTIITHTKNQGYGKTIRELYFSAKTRWLFSVPGDFQIDPMEIFKLWKEKERGDIILGVRHKRQDGWIRGFISRIYHILLYVLYGVTVHDVDSVRLVRTHVLPSLGLMSVTAFVDAEMIVRATQKRLRVVEISIEHKPRLYGISRGIHWSTSIPTFLDILRLWPTLRSDQ